MKRIALFMALVLTLGLLVACGGGEKTTEAPAAGETFTGSAEGFSTDTPIEVEVVKDGDTITAVTITKHAESVDDVAEVKEALEAIPAAIVEANGTDGVDIIAGATYTCEGIINAVNNALGQ